MTEAPALVRIERSGPVAIVYRDNPPVNALTLPMTRELHAALTDIAADASVRAVVITAAGNKSFGAGSDISEFEPLIDENAVIEKKVAFENETFSLLASLPQPTVAALNGSAFGGGLEIALACDLIIAEHGQTVGLPEVKLGLYPGSGGPVRLVRRIGEARSKEMIFFGEPIDVERALNWGLINAVENEGQGLAAAVRWAERLAAGSVSGLQGAKRAVHAAVDVDRGERVIVGDFDAFRTTFAHPDAIEGARAFLDKRAPKFPSASG